MPRSRHRCGGLLPATPTWSSAQRTRASPKRAPKRCKPRPWPNPGAHWGPASPAGRGPRPQRPALSIRAAAVKLPYSSLENQSGDACACAHCATICHAPCGWIQTGRRGARGSALWEAPAGNRDGVSLRPNRRAKKGRLLHGSNRKPVVAPPAEHAANRAKGEHGAKLVQRMQFP